MNFWTDQTKATEGIAQELLGCLLIKETDEGITSGWIVETEAYVGEFDEAAHSFGLRKTPRLKAMYQPAGTIYIYHMHTHTMLNIIAKEAGNPQGILFRAIEPFSGVELMEERRKMSGINVTNGPGKLTKAMGITKEDYGTSIGEAPLYLSTQQRRIPKEIIATSRIGIPNKGKWTDAPLRFIVAGNPYVSRKKGPVDLDFGWQ
ncbi:DNA-3-methyladenine glycosylase [Desemzia sp. FAM 24101]|uniref:DNA-3-methyladenine glycosylase n=1 Tax=unclassified Desemzia TaxID=2685243 RepID=UPI0038869144